MSPPLMNATKRNIMAALASRLTAMGYFGAVETSKIKLKMSDIRPTELPYCQLISIGEEIVHERPRTKRSWIIHIEVVLKSDATGIVDQSSLWDAQEAVEAQLGGNLQLDLVGMVDITLRGTIDDLHLLEPYYTMRIEIACKYFTTYSGLP